MRTKKRKRKWEQEKEWEQKDENEKKRKKEKKKKEEAFWTESEHKKSSSVSSKYSHPYFPEAGQRFLSRWPYLSQAILSSRICNEREPFLCHDVNHVLQGKLGCWDALNGLYIHKLYFSLDLSDDILGLATSGGKRRFG